MSAAFTPRPEAVEAARRAFFACAGGEGDEKMQAAIVEFCRVEELTVEKLHAMEFDQQRVVGPWHEVEEGR